MNKKDFNNPDDFVPALPQDADLIQSPVRRIIDAVESSSRSVEFSKASPTVKSSDGLDFDPQVLALLRYNFTKGQNEKMACFLSGISYEQYKAVLKLKPHYKEHFMMLYSLRDAMVEETITKQIRNENLDMVKFYATSRMKEYQPKSKVEHEHTMTLAEAISLREQQVNSIIEGEVV